MANVVEATDRLGVRRALDEIGVLLGLLADLRHRRDEGVEDFGRLGLGRLDEQALRDEQREVGRRGVEAVVEQPLGDVHRRDARLPGEPLQRDD